MKFDKIRYIWITDFGGPDFSFGIHVCMDFRIDIHILKWMISIGRVPIYKEGDTLFAVSNSFHNRKSKRVRAGVP